MKTKLLFVVTCLFISFQAISQYTFIPDSNFEQALIDLGHDSDGIINQQVLTSDIASIVSLDVSNQNIISLEGIEDFSSLNILNCYNNQIVSIDISDILSLEEFSCWDNQLTSLDVTNNTKLKQLYCGLNQLTALDVSSNVELEILHCLQNDLNNLDVSSNFALFELFCESNQISSLDVSDNPALLKLRCEYNQLTSLDVSGNPALLELSCDNNQLTSLDVTNNIELEEFSCWNNQLTSLDVLENTNLKTLLCGFNQLTDLDVSSNIELKTLHCPQNQLSSLNVSNNEALSELRCDVNQLASLDVSNNPALVYLKCEYNQLTGLDLSSNPALKVLSCENNQLTSLDVSYNLELEHLSCWYNQLTSLDVTNNSSLQLLFCGYNQLTELDVSLNNDLENLHCLHNDLTELDVSNNVALVELHCDNNQLTSINLKNGNNYNFISLRIQDNPDLFCVQVDDADYSNSNWTNKDDHTSFSENCGGDTLSSEYVVIAKEKVVLKTFNNVASGSVAVLNSNGKARLRVFSQVVESVEASDIYVDFTSIVGNELQEPADIDLPEFKYNLVSDSDSPNVVVNNNQTVTLDESEYGTVFVKQGGTVIFSNSNVYLKKLKMHKSASIEFTGCSNVYIQEKVKFNRYSTFNNTEENVFVYVDGRVDVERGSSINGRIHSNQSIVKAKGKIWSPTQLSGLFIGNKVKGEKFVSWTKNSSLIPCNVTDETVARIGDVKEKKKIDVEEEISKAIIAIDEFDVKTWPIPSNNQFNIKVSGLDTSELVSLNVYDINGRLVYKDSFNSLEQYSFGSNLQSGIYVVKIFQDSNVKTFRIIKN